MRLSPSFAAPLGLLLGLLPSIGLGQNEPAEPPERSYSLVYDARLVPSQRSARVTLRLDNGKNLVRSIRLRIDPERHRGFEGNGEIEMGEEFVEWKPPDGPGRLTYDFRIDALRDERSYDARCGEDWALFRGDDLVPRARVRALSGARAEARLRLRVPAGWSAVAPYPKEPPGVFVIENPLRRFDRPTGWILVGHLGVLRERVAGSHVAVAGPVGHGLRRLDVLALLRWTLPSLREVLGELPERLLVVGAGDPMWRGGLSGPSSVFIHADLPLITNDGTSPVLHEVVHAALGAARGTGGDWIVEGLAEYYSIEMLRRSRTISRRRYEKILARLAERGAGVRLEAEQASGARVARAVTVLHELDEQIREDSGDVMSLDDVVRALAQREMRLTTDSFREIAESVSGQNLASFFRRRVPTS
ncbi:MAG: hypothetical protein ABFS46_09970 [Myxococcota bacterium]